MHSVILIIWQKPTSHTDDCYFCTIPPLQHGMSRKNSKSDPQKSNVDCGISKHSISYCQVPHGDLLVILLGMQLGYCCLLCKLGSHTRFCHYKRNVCPTRSLCIQYSPLFNQSKIILPSLHIKLSLLKNSVNGMNRMEKVSSIWEENFYSWVMPKLRNEFLLAHKFVKFWKIKLQESFHWQFKKAI